MQASSSMSRREFVSSVATVAAGVTVVPRHVLGGPGCRAPSDRVQLGLIGAGSQGMSNINVPVQADHILVAIADVDWNFVDSQIAQGGTNPDGSPNPERRKLQEAYAKARRYVDFRVMLEKEHQNLDGVIIATPDHGHAVQAKAAMDLGLAVYVQKPLTWSVYEARVLQYTAARTGVVTQMGNQGHSSDESKRVIEWIRAGVIGPVREVHVWTNRPIWPQGIPRPTHERLRNGTQFPRIRSDGTFAVSGPGGSFEPGEEIDWAVTNIQQPIARAMAGDYAVPPGLEWDLFLGPAPEVPYHPIYHPFNWRGWVDWGVGALGDMGAHLLDQPYAALELGLPTSISATSTPFGMDARGLPATWPQAMMVQYRFPARGDRPPVELFWYDGGLMPPRPELLPPEVTLDPAGGVYYVGDRGIFIHGQRGTEPHLFFPESLREEADRVPVTLPRVPTDHITNWVNAIMGLAEPSSSFDYAAPLTETMLLGLVALQVGQGREILYDGENMRITNIPEANHLLHREYRSGWSL